MFVVLFFLVIKRSRKWCLVSFLDGLLFELFHLFQDFFDGNFADTVTAETREHCSPQNGQVAQQQIVDGRTNVSEYDECTSGTQIVLRNFSNNNDERKKLNIRLVRNKNQIVYVKCKKSMWIDCTREEQCLFN